MVAKWPTAKKRPFYSISKKLALPPVSTAISLFLSINWCVLKKCHSEGDRVSDSYKVRLNDHTQDLLTAEVETFLTMGNQTDLISFMVVVPIVS
jgi:hypothetical protein